MPFRLEQGIGILGWGSLAEGFLTDNFELAALSEKDFRRRHRFGQRENYERIVSVRERLRLIAARRGKRIVDLVIAWELMHPALTGAIIGIRSDKEAREMVGRVGWKLDEAEMAAVGEALAIWER